MKVLSVDWDQNGVAKNNALFDSIIRFTEREFGQAKANLGQYNKVFAAVRDNGEVNALGGVVLRYDCPMFHVTRPENDRPAQRDALEASDLLYNRLSYYLQDVGAGGFETFVYVDPATGDRWKSFLERRGAREAHRWIVIP